MLFYLHSLDLVGKFTLLNQGLSGLLEVVHD
jgi:hypothetical protein